VKLFISVLLFSASALAVDVQDFRQTMKDYLHLENLSGVYEGQDGRFPCQVWITEGAVTLWNGKNMVFKFDDANPLVREIDRSMMGSVTLTVRGYANSFRRFEDSLKMSRNSDQTTFLVKKKWDADGPFDDRAQCKVNNVDLY
jgi:hypothetical protein